MKKKYCKINISKSFRLILPEFAQTYSQESYLQYQIIQISFDAISEVLDSESMPRQTQTDRHRPTCRPTFFINLPSSYNHD